MKTFWKKFIWTAIIIFLSSLFANTDKVFGIKEGYVVKISLDDLIPFIPQFIYFYLFYFILFIFMVFRVQFFDFDKIGKKFFRSAVFLAVSSLLVYIIFPTKIIRNEIEPENLSLKLLYYFRLSDTPFNALPSMHVASLTLLIFLLKKYDKKLYKILLIPVLLCIVSTVLVKQHYLLDIPTGILAGYLCYYLFFIQKRITWELIVNFFSKKEPVQDN